MSYSECNEGYTLTKDLPKGVKLAFFSVVVVTLDLFNLDVVLIHVVKQ